MFFSISKNVDISFPNQTTFGNLIVNHDNGWNLQKDFIYKGFSDQGILDLKDAADIENYKNKKGTFCILFFKDESIEVITGKKQKFPIFIDYEHHVASNLYETKTTSHNGVTISEHQIKVDSDMPLVFTPKKITDDVIIEKINLALESSLTSFRHDHPFKLFVTGGFDTLLIAAYVLKNKIPYELVYGEHGEMDHFTCYHRNRILKSFWAYRTIQHWKTPEILLTGAHGDEMLLRDATQAFLFLKHHGEDLLSVIAHDKNLYQSIHYSKKECLETYDTLENVTFDSEQDLKSWMLNTFARDYQHWHLGNTIFFTIFDDLDLLDLSLNLSYEKIRAQLLDGEICRTLIEMNRPGLLKLLSNNKNHNYFEKLSDLYEGKIKLENI